MTDHQHLRELAQRATPGPWGVMQDFIDMGVPDNSMTLYAAEDDAPSDQGRTLGSIYLHSWADGYNENRNAEFIAAANPTVILDLLAELEDTRAAYQLTRRQLDAHRAGQGTWVHAELGGDTYVIHEGNTQ